MIANYVFTDPNQKPLQIAQLDVEKNTCSNPAKDGVKLAGVTIY